MSTATRKPSLALIAATLLPGCGNGQATQQDAAVESAVEVQIRPDSVILDYGTAEMRIYGRLIKTEGPAPQSVWVWAYFVNPAEAAGGSRSDLPIELVAPFSSGDTATVIARGSFHWATTADVPRSGFYATVFASSVSAEDVQVRPTNRSYDVSGAVPVVAR